MCREIRLGVAAVDGWVNDEVAGCDFPDERLKFRFARLLHDFGRRIGSAIPFAPRDRAATKAACRFFDNPRIDEGTILAEHFATTISRFAATQGPVLVLHDTTEFSFQRIEPELIGQTCAMPSRISGGAPRTMCGILMHSSLVVTPAGLPLGLAAVKFWTREKFNGQLRRSRPYGGCRKKRPATFAMYCRRFTVESWWT